MPEPNMKVSKEKVTEMEQVIGLVFDIQGFSIHDGPGCRTLVFLSGCPLRCEWCANPEGMEIKQRLMYSTQKCRHLKEGCIRCLKACPFKAISINTADQHAPLFIDRSWCKCCQERHCVHACYYEALRLSGKWMTLTELLNHINRDKVFWGDNGGVTFSGGEPCLQREFLLSALKKCKAANIHTAIETSACVPQTSFLEIMEQVDFAFIDVKHMNTTKHKEKTGLDNRLILDNIRILKASSWPGRLILRIPIIRNFNDHAENILKVANFMNELNLFEVNILPFHRLGASKWAQLGMTYKYKDETPTYAKTLDHLQDLFLDKKIACYVGTEVFY